MTNIYRVIYKTFPEPGKRHDQEDIIISNGLKYPRPGTRSFWSFNDDTTYSEDEVVKIEVLGKMTDDDLESLIREHPDADWEDWLNVYYGNHERQRELEQAIEEARSDAAA